MAGEKYELLTFPVRFENETVRLVLTAAGIKYEDKHVDYCREWPELKERMLGRRLPILKIVNANGSEKIYSENLAIARFLARQHNMMGKTDEEYYHVEKIISQSADVCNECFRFFWKSVKEIDQLTADIASGKSPFKIENFSKMMTCPPEEKQRLLNEVFSFRLAEILQNICISLKESSGKLAVGDHITLADLTLLYAIDHVMDLDPKYLEGKYPEIHQHRENLLASSPNLASYLNCRPKTLF